jgi:hypothetical protein
MIGLGIAAVVAIVAVVAIGMSGDDDDTATGPPAGVTLDDLEPALLTEDEVGNGFSLDTGGDDSDDPMDSESIDASDECRAAIESFEVSDAAREEIGVDFADDVGGTVQQSVSLAGEGIPTVAETRQAIDQCDSMAFEDEGATGEYRFETSDVDGLGDDAVGLTVGVDMEAQGYSLEFDMYGVLWERDGVNSSVFGFGGFDEATLEGLPVDEAWVRDLAATADGRVAAVLGG